MRNPLASLFVPPASKGMSGANLLAWLRGEDIDLSQWSENQAMRVAVVASCVRLIAHTIAALPLHAYRRDAADKARVPVSHPLERLLRRPNEYQTAFAFRAQLQASLLLRGNAYAHIAWVRDARAVDGWVAEAWHPIHPDYVEVVTGGYRVAVPGQPARTLPSDEVLHLFGLSSDGRTGRSVLADASEAMGVALSTQRYAQRFFENDATPSVVLKHPGRLTNEVAGRLKAAWDAMFSGADNARRTAVLEDGMSLERLTLTAEDAQFLETRKFQRSELCGLFGVPPQLVGITDNTPVWGNGIEQNNIAFATYGLQPWLVCWEQAITQKVIKADETYFVEHSLEGLLRGDTLSRYQAYAIGIDRGFLSPNEVRRRENFNGYDGGDEYGYRATQRDPATREAA